MIGVRDQPSEGSVRMADSGACAVQLRPANILFVLPWSPDEIGGVSEVVINLYRRFAARSGFDPGLLVDAYPQRLVVRENSRALGEVDCFHLPAPPLRGKRLTHLLAFAARLPPALLRFGLYLRRRRVDAINIHFPSLGGLAVLAVRTLAAPRAPVVLSFHGSDLNAVRSAGPVERRLWRAMVARSDAVVVCSRALGDEVVQCFPGIGERLHVVHNGVDGPACREARARGAVPPELRGRRFIACVATFEHKKGQDILLESFRRIAPRFPDVALVLVGRSGPTLERLRALVAGTGFSDRIVLLPDQDHADTLAIMGAAELLALPSRQEPFGIVILEAAVLGVPVVASRVGGIPEIVDDGRSGALVPPDDPHALAAAIGKMLGDRVLAKSCADALRADAESRFTWTQAAMRYAALFKPPPREGGAPRSAR